MNRSTHIDESGEGGEFQGCPKLHEMSRSFGNNDVNNASRVEYLNFYRFEFFILKYRDIKVLKRVCSIFTTSQTGLFGQAIDICPESFSNFQAQVSKLDSPNSNLIKNSKNNNIPRVLLHSSKAKSNRRFLPRKFSRTM